MRRHVRTDTTRLFDIWSLMLFKDCKEHKSYCFLVSFMLSTVSSCRLDVDRMYIKLSMRAVMILRLFPCNICIVNKNISRGVFCVFIEKVF